MNNKDINLKEIAEKLKDRVLFPEALERVKSYLKNATMEIIWSDEKALHFAKWVSVNEWTYNAGLSRWVKDSETMLTNEEMMKEYKKSILS